MFSFRRSFVMSSAATLLGFAIGALAAVTNGDYREASTAAFQLAEAHKHAGETAKSCTALAQSLEYYRKANAADEPATSSLRDGSDGMAEVRAKFGCK